MSASLDGYDITIQYPMKGGTLQTSRRLNRVWGGGIVSKSVKIKFSLNKGCKIHGHVRRALTNGGGIIFRGHPSGKYNRAVEFARLE